MTFVLGLTFLLAALSVRVHGQSLPFQVNSQRTCDTQISLDTTTLTGVRRGDDDSPCSGYLLYTDQDKTLRMCSSAYWQLNNYVAQRVCYTLGVNTFRDSVFDAFTTRQMQLYRCFSYKEQNVESVEAARGGEVFEPEYTYKREEEAQCRDRQADSSAHDCFDECYYRGTYSVPDLTTEDSCTDGTAFHAIGCSDINECVNGVRDYCTGPFDDSCTIRQACGNNTDCTNHPGSFECSCKNGYEYRSGDSFNPYDLAEGCIDIDECKQSPCDVNAKCVNTVGSYLCWCRDGFTGDGKTCTPISCHDVPSLPNANYKFAVAGFTSYVFGDTVVYECDEGYKVSVQNLPETLVNYYGYSTTDSFTLTCDENGDWGPYPVPQCLPVDCGDPRVVPNAVIDVIGSMFKQEVTYTCEEGFLPQKYGTSRSFTRTCQADGAWTEGTTCDDVDECQQDVCTEKQYCVNIKGSYLCLAGIPDSCDIQGFCTNGDCKLVNGKAECVCDKGYSGVRCETPTTNTALIVAIVALVFCGLLTILLLMVLWMWCIRHRHLAGPPQSAVSPAMFSRTGYPKAYGFRRPPF